MNKTENIDKLASIVKVSCIEKGFEEYDYQKFITYRFIIQNKSEKTIRAIKGGIKFNNIFDEEIQTLKLVYDQPIKALKQTTYNATTDYNQYVDEDRALRNKDLKDIKVIWIPEKVIFADGTSLE